MRRKPETKTVFLQLIAHRERWRVRVEMFLFPGCNPNGATTGREIAPPLFPDFGKAKRPGEVGGVR